MKCSAVISFLNRTVICVAIASPLAVYGQQSTSIILTQLASPREPQPASQNLTLYKQRPPGEKIVIQVVPDSTLANPPVQPKESPIQFQTQKTVPIQNLRSILKANMNGKAQGGVGDGGGSALACFNDEKIVPHVLDTEGRIKPEYRNSVAQLLITDALEQRENGAVFNSIPETTSEQYLNRIIQENIEPFSPAFARQLKLALAATHPSKWTDTGASIPFIHDVGESPELSALLDFYKDNCVLVQLVHRKEIQTDHGTQVASIEYDQQLFNRIDSAKGDQRGSAYKKALIWLHEALYFMGSQFGQENSMQARQLAGYLLSRDAKQLRDPASFLFMLDSLGYLQPQIYGFKKSNTASRSEMENPKYQRLLLLSQIFELLHEKRRQQLTKVLNQDCAQINAVWKNADCNLYASKAIGYSIDADIIESISKQSISDHDAFFLFAILSTWEDDFTSFESLLDVAVDDTAMMEKLCLNPYAVSFLAPQHKIRVKTNRYCAKIRRN